MNALSLNFDWLTSGNNSPEIQQTMGMFGLRVGDISLTRNEDTFSQTIRDTVLVSAYPLAAWIASSWWRLLFEPLPPNAKPSVDWRMAHELTAANQGFIWPRVILASDTELMQIWSTPSKAVDQQSVRYINGLERPYPIDLHEFQLKAEKFIENDSVSPDTPQAPWQRGNKVASLLRDEIDIRENPIPDDTLYDLLGLKKSEYEDWTPPHRQHISVAVPLTENRFKFHPRKKHPIAKRFELARLIGDYLFYGNRGESWLTSTDLRTSRQKYQRAFAAEFLCPLSSLQDYLGNDYSESAIEDAGDRFQVSSQTVESILVNNGLIPSPQSLSDLEASLPY